MRVKNPANRPSLLHVLSAAMQNIPVEWESSVHAAFPQMQGAALLGTEPFVFVQAEAVTPEA